MSPYLQLELANKTGPFLIDYGASDSVVEKGIWATPANDTSWTNTIAGSKFPLGPFNLPGWKAGKVNFLVEQRDIYLDAAKQNKQLGVLGVDLFANQIVELDYSERPHRAYVSDYPAPNCPAQTLTASGLSMIDQSDHWASGTTAPDGINNGPVLYARFATLQHTPVQEGIFWGQLDTGYDDSIYKHTIVINAPLRQNLSGLGVTLTKVGTVSTRTCKGDVTADVLASQHELVLTSKTGDSLVRVAGVHLVAAAANGCGGISGSSRPAAQFGSSFLAAIGRTVIVGPRKEVWIGP